MNQPSAPLPQRISIFGKLVRFFAMLLAGLIAFIALVILAFNIYLSTRPAAKTVRPVGIISIPTPFELGRPFIDYMVIDGHTLYAGYASKGLVAVIDTDTNKTLAPIGGLPRAHGIALVAGRNLGFASASGDSTVGIFDLSNHALQQKISAGVHPDAIIYDEKANLVYVGDHDGKAGILIDPVAQKVVGSVPLGGEAEYPQADPNTGLIYQNLEDTNEAVVIDPQKQAIAGRYNLRPAEGPTGLALDAANHRLFCATRSRQLIVLDTNTGAIIAALPIGAATDGAAYDSVLRRIYTANALGTMTVIQQDSADHYHVLENAPTHFGGHSLVVDPRTHRIYVAYFGSIAAYDAIQAN